MLEEKGADDAGDGGLVSKDIDQTSATDYQPTAEA
jgi:hypothetical protein